MDVKYHHGRWEMQTQNRCGDIVMIPISRRRKTLDSLPISVLTRRRGNHRWDIPSERMIIER
jgi:hypothetical protein